ncbi:uncharacterized protein GGS25DRAFT_316614 [Hypoxylon fragiforme]|uniref:uncharacterized protein n=1 Tax=Hypoxylon fragiforme TaxID=63214 RepID=UPI0020C5E8C6|nr:uncharacterized protein GGS25DRAFT_316614 [Hypoxylon fragiforme]KAI2607037.1 hypothetical protein GGS25DRAFT_316614 [Hypoxylon fragiforme]
MSSIIKITTSLACLVTAVLANGGDCPPGKVFYSCANGYRGCFEKDPCALPPFTSTTIIDPKPTSIVDRDTPKPTETIVDTPGVGARSDDPTQCVPGKVFYSCANGYRGCFAKDPCDLPPAAKTSLVLPKPTQTFETKVRRDTPKPTETIVDTPNVGARSDDPTQCLPGKVFYSCANGYRGCYAQDPCALPPIATTTPPIGTVTPTPTPTAGVCAPGSTGEVRQPKMYNLYPAQPDLADPPVSQLEVHRVAGSAAREQVAIFAGIPAGATQCVLQWQAAAASERHFTVDGNGSLEAARLSGVPAEPVSAGSVAGQVGGEEGVLHPDFTNWPLVATAHNSTAGVIACAEALAYKFAINQDSASGDGSVFLAQDAKNGLYVSYKC